MGGILAMQYYSTLNLDAIVLFLNCCKSFSVKTRNLKKDLAVFSGKGFF